MPADHSIQHAASVETTGATAHLPRLDGLRALAVFAVLIFHAEYFHAGWIGVQVFFVLSGFLITRILVASKQKSPSQPGEFFARFYWRRTLRIFPLYFAFLLILAAVYLLTRRPAFFAEASPWLFTYTFNFARLAPHSPYMPAFGHLWSLAVEEQFYLLWPAAVWLLSAQKLRRLILAMILAAPVLRWCAGYSLAAWSQDQVHLGTAIYSLLTSHLDAFGLGAALATGLPLLTRHAGRKLIACLIALTIAGLLTLRSLQAARLAGWSSLGYPHALPWHFQYVWAYTLINFAAAWLIALLIAPASSRGFLRLLEHPVPAYLGRISYGLYVWHAPVLVLTASALHVGSFQPIGIAGLLIATTVTIALAAASFHGFESRFLSFKDRRPWAHRPRPSAAGSESFLSRHEH